MKRQQVVKKQIIHNNFQGNSLPWANSEHRQLGVERAQQQFSEPPSKTPVQLVLTSFAKSLAQPLIQRVHSQLNTRVRRVSEAAATGKMVHCSDSGRRQGVNWSLKPLVQGKVKSGKTVPCSITSAAGVVWSPKFLQNKVKIGERESGKSADHCSISTSMGSVVEALECTLSFTQIPLFFVRSVTKALNLKQKLQSPSIRLFVLLSPGQH